MMQLSWTARVYNRFVGKSLRELNSYAGIRRSISRQTAAAGLPRRNVLLEIGTDSCPELPITKRSKQGDILSHLLVKGQKPLKPCQLKRQLQTFEQPPDKMVEEVEKSLPREFDWRKARGGRNFLEPVMDQADCGSCYAVSTMRMLTARHKVKTNNTNAEPWSISFPLHCGEYTQGCNGGYGFLVSKWSEDVGLIPASCAPYNTSGTCHSTCDPKTMKKRYRAANHHLVGGFYGNSSSVPMMLELFNHGPLVVSFEPTDDFMMYSGGIFSQLELSVPAPLVKHNSEWQKVDHAVLLIGWGEENGQKYWMVQNSWGADWGEAGYFRISRDNNECGVESQAECAEVVEDDHPEVLVDFVQQLP
jgi:cathepsin C